MLTKLDESAHKAVTNEFDWYKNSILTPVSPSDGVR